jgi:hypothetical protein
VEQVLRHPDRVQQARQECRLIDVPVPVIDYEERSPLRGVPLHAVTMHTQLM